MFKHFLSKTVAPLACMVLFSTFSQAANPTSLASSTEEYNAYVYSYTSMVKADGIANVMSDSGTEGEVAQWVADLVGEAFDHCYFALIDDDDSLWADAAEDLSLARFWCDTLVVYAQDSQSGTVVYDIEILMWYLDIAIANAEDATFFTKGRYQHYKPAKENKKQAKR